MVIRRESKSRTRNFLRMSCEFMRSCVRLFRRVPASPHKCQEIPWRATEAAELVEFALLLPILLVMVVGLLDFATAYNLKQKLANAAREGARMGSSQPTCDLSTSTPASVQSIKDDVTTYLQQAGVNTSFIAATMTYSTASPCTATYYTSSGGTNYGLKIERCIPIVDASGMTLSETHVTLTYPYDWTYGFNHIIQLLIPSATGIAQIGIETDAIMANLEGC